MVQESIVEYINSQMKLGVSRDTIKATLTGAGWQAADVEDTLKKMESAKAVQAQPMSAAAGAGPASMPMTATTAAAKPAMSAMGPGATANPASQTIKMSDLVSASPASSMQASIKSSGPKSPLTGPMPTATKAPDTFQTTSFSSAKPHGSRSALITEIVLAVIILVVGGFAGFLFMQNNSLNSQLASLNGQSSGVNSQLSALQAQAAASTTALTAQISVLVTADHELSTELSFLVPPPGTIGSATSTGTVSGTVAAGKTGYVITASYGTKILVANSKSAAVIAALIPLMASTPAVATSTTSKTATSTASSTSTSTSTSISIASSTAPMAPTAPTIAQFTGTYVPGSDMITLTSVNGTSL